MRTIVAGQIQIRRSDGYHMVGLWDGGKLMALAGYRIA